MTEQNSYRRPYDNEVNLLDYWEVISGRWRLVAALTAAALVISVVVSLLLPKEYESRASILPPQQDSGIGSGVLSSLPSGLSGLAGGLLGAGSKADSWVGILSSRTVTDAIIERFDLRNVYGTKTIEDARDALRSNVTIAMSDYDIVSVTVLDTDPGRAASIAEAYIEELDRVNREAVTTAGRRTRVFVEKRLEEVRRDLSGAEEAVREFQSAHNAIQLDAQSEAIIESIGTVKAELMSREVALETLLSYATPENPAAQVLATEVKELRKKLGDLERGAPEGLSGDDGGVFIPTSKIPDLGLRYMRLMRDTKVQATLFELLTEQYEIARIQEAKDSPTVQVLDTPVPAEKKSRPKRTLIVGASTMFGFFAGIVIAFIRNRIDISRKATGQC